MRDIKFNITKAEEGAAFAVHVVPKSAKNEVVGKHGDALKVNLTSASVGGAANELLLNFMAEKLNVERQNVEIAAGLAGKEKMVIVVGISPVDVERLLLG
ncbi:MAG: hypothetical protein FOGNACKC_00256 [Anaerolineae bacterium]|mgnify:CR=1 FL=1|nr:hypothetical protein [Anaerolineae bacterium]